MNKLKMCALGLGAMILMLPTAVRAEEGRVWLTPPAVTLTTEGFWNTTTGIANWVTLLNTDYEFGLWRDGVLCVDLLAVANLRQEQGKSGVADNLHLFSAIEDSPSTLALMTFGVGQGVFDGSLHLFAGVRNLGKDYFTTPWNSIFTSAMNGLFPSIATNFVVADAPKAAMALHAEWHPNRHWSAKMSIYDGVASELWSELFSLNLRRDGIFMLGEVGYSGDGRGYVGTYNIGASYGYAPSATTLARGGEEKSSRASLWLLAEQPIYRWAGGRELEMILHGAWAPQSDCDLYGGVAVVCSSLCRKSDYVGLLLARGLYRGGAETQMELTYSLPVGHFNLQPALHRVYSTHGNYTIAMMKVVLTM